MNSEKIKDIIIINNISIKMHFNIKIIKIIYKKKNNLKKNKKNDLNKKTK